MNVFIINSPLQLLSAIEAKLHFKTKNNILIIMYCSDERTNKQINALIKMHPWENTITLPRQSKIIRIPKLIKALKKYGTHIETVFNSSIDNINSQVLLSNFTPKQLCYIDDGMSFIRFNEKLIKNKSMEFTPPPFYLRLILSLQGVTSEKFKGNIENLIIFTMLPIENCPLPIIKNKLPWLKSKIKQTANKKVGFIGQADVVGIKESEISFETHVDILKKIHEKTQAEIIYFPHRRESKTQLKKISELSFVKMHHSRLPLELEICIENLELKNLIGYTSTALFTIDNLYDELKVNFIKPSPFTKKASVNALAIESYLEQELKIQKWSI